MLRKGPGTLLRHLGMHGYLTSTLLGGMLNALLVEWKSEVVGVARRVHRLEWSLALSRYC